MNIPQDKLIHFLGGFLVAGVFALLGYPLHGLFVGAVVAVGKEIFDYYHPPHQCELMDAVATFAGALLAFTLTLIKEAL